MEDRSGSLCRKGGRNLSDGGRRHYERQLHPGVFLRRTGRARCPEGDGECPGGDGDRKGRSVRLLLRRFRQV